ncbi:MAG TPA: helix-turn-helix transcriptional regulator [Catalimonadaceae bacterium]|nr:helix-turn-helix transcriptional regulator [Catalimonadaceae bacterium]
MRRPKEKLSRRDFEHLSIRNQLGLSQDELSDFLGIKPSQVGMAEVGLRPMPPRAQDNLFLLKFAYIEAIKVFEDEITNLPITNEEREKLVDEIDELQFEKNKLLRNMVDMKARNKKVDLLFSVCNRLIAKVTNTESFPLKAANFWLDKCLHKFTKTGRLPQARIQFRIDEIDRKIAFLEGFLN